MNAIISNQMPYLPMQKKPDTLSFWLFIAAAIHAVVLIGVTFTSPEPAPINKTIEVTIVNTRGAKKPPENAKYYAQANQIAAGNADQKPTTVLKKHPSKGQDRKKQKAIAAATQVTIEHRLITRKTAAEKMASAQKVEAETEAAEKKAQPQPEMSMEELDRQIAQLGAKIEELKESAEKTPSVKSLNQISAHKDVAAGYIEEWKRIIEKNGIANYPQINGRKDFSASLLMEVQINYNGEIRGIAILKSSGIPALDAAAKKIVEDSAPFPPLPEVITPEVDVLSIRREWSFSQEAISSSVSD